MIKHFTLRIPDDQLRRLHDLAAYSGRSINGQLLVIIRYILDEYEQIQQGSTPSPLIRKIIR